MFKSVGNLSSNAWRFYFGFGNQPNVGKNVSLSSWAVRSGDVIGPVVPEPGTVLLMAAGLGLGLFGFARKQRRR